MNSRFALPIQRGLALVALALGLAVFGSACGLLGDDEDDPGSSGNYTVLQAVLGTQINDQQQLTVEPARAFPPETSQIYAVIVLQGLRVGSEVTGRWYQLSTQDAPPEGAFVSEAGVTLTQDNVSGDGAGRVVLNLGSNSGALPQGDWVVRVYVDGEFVRTMGFVITPLVAAGGQQQPTQPEQPAPTPAEATQPPPEEPTPIPESYTVEPGDTLTIIAEQFKTPAESTDAYIDRLVELNDLPPGSILFVGQELLLPGPPP